MSTSYASSDKANNCADSLFINKIYLHITCVYAAECHHDTLLCNKDATKKIFGYHLNQMERRKIIMVDCYALCGYQQVVMDIFASMKVRSDLYHYTIFGEECRSFKKERIHILSCAVLSVRHS